MPLVDRAQIGFKKETTWGTPVTVTRFSEFVTEKIKPMHGRVMSSGLRSGQRVRRTDRQVPYIIGAQGPVVVEVLSAGFGFWLEHMLGSVATSAPTDSKYTHTGSIGAMTGLGFTFQTNHPFHPANTDQAYTYEGGKVSKWTLDNKVGDPLAIELQCDFENYSTATALAAASYPTAAEMLTFAGGLVTVGGVNFDITETKITCDNKLYGTSDSDNRRYIRANTQHKEPVEGDMRDVSWELTADFDSLTQFNRFSSITAAGALATIVLTWTGNILIGVSSLPTFVVTIQNASFDDFQSTVDNANPLSQKLTGAGLYDGTNSAITLAYGTADSTP